MITQELINILACPKCKGPVKFQMDKLICEKCLLAYRIEENIPVMLLEEAVDIAGSFKNNGGDLNES